MGVYLQCRALRHHISDVMTYQKNTHSPGMFDVDKKIALGAKYKPCTCGNVYLM